MAVRAFFYQPLFSLCLSLSLFVCLSVSLSLSLSQRVGEHVVHGGQTNTVAGVVAVPPLRTATRSSRAGPVLVTRS